MRVRPYEPADRERVLELRAKHGDQFVFADPDDPLNRIYLLLEAEDGELLGAIAGRVTVEAFLMLNKARGCPKLRWEWARQLFEAGSRMAYNMGFGEQHFWVHQRLRSFARRLADIPGFIHEQRHSFTVNLKERYLG